MINIYFSVSKKIVPVPTCEVGATLNFTGFTRFFISYLYAATVDSMTRRYSIYGSYKLL